MSFFLFSIHISFLFSLCEFDRQYWNLVPVSISGGVLNLISSSEEEEESTKTTTTIKEPLFEPFPQISVEEIQSIQAAIGEEATQAALKHLRLNTPITVAVTQTGEHGEKDLDRVRATLFTPTSSKCYTKTRTPRPLKKTVRT